MTRGEGRSDTTAPARQATAAFSVILETLQRVRIGGTASQARAQHARTIQERSNSFECTYLRADAVVCPKETR